MKMMMLAMGASFLLLSGCASTGTNAEFTCRAPKGGICAPLHHTDERITQEQDAFARPFTDDSDAIFLSKEDDHVK